MASSKNSGKKGGKMKNKMLLLVFVILIPVWARAVIFEETKSSGESIAPGITAANLNTAVVRVNGKKIEIQRYKSREPVKKILDASLEKAESQGSRLINNHYLWLAANALFKAAGSGAKNDSFGYIFMIDKNDTAVFVIAGASGDMTEIVKSVTANYSNEAKGGYDDGLKHFPGAERVLSIELVSDGRTVNFSNLYRMRKYSRFEIRNYYEGEFKNNRLVVLKNGYLEKADSYILKGEKRELFFSISEQPDGEVIIYLMG
jgi:hypothetical protein